MSALVLGRIVLAAVFAAAAVGKLRDLPGSREAMEGFGVPARFARVPGTLLPLAELLVAVALGFDATAAGGALAALSLLLVFCVAIAWNLVRGRAPDCHCFGQLHSARASWRTVGRNVGLAALAFALAASLGAAVPAVVLAAVAVLLLAPAAVLDLRRGRTAVPVRSGSGLQIGSAAPDFELPALDGARHTIESLTRAGLPLMLIFSDPHCGPCQALAPEVARWQREFSEELTIAVVERPDGVAGAPQRPAPARRRARRCLRGARHADRGAGLSGRPDRERRGRGSE
jgi:hypothetical protein